MDKDGTISAAISAAYGLPAPLVIHPLTEGTNNHSYRVECATGRFFLKHSLTSQNTASLQYEHRLLTWLADQPLSFAIPTPLPSHTQETLLIIGSDLYALFTWLLGEPPTPTVAQAEAFGSALGELHTVLASYPTDPRPGMSAYSALDQVHPRLPHPERLDLPALGLSATAELITAMSWWHAEMRTLQAFVAGPYRQLTWQVIHGDVGFVNSLFAGTTLTALLDFEFAGPDVRALDLAAALRSLLRRHELPAAIALAQALLRGYQRQASLTDAERTAIPMLIRLSSTVSTIWWLGRALATGDTAAMSERLLRAYQLAQALEQHQDLLQGWLA